MGFRFPLTVVCLSLSIHFGFYSVKGITAKPSIPASQRHVEKLASQLLLQHTPRSRQTSAFLFFFSCSSKGPNTESLRGTPDGSCGKERRVSESLPFLPPQRPIFTLPSPISPSLATFSHSPPGQSFVRRRQCEWSSKGQGASLAHTLVPVRVQRHNASNLATSGSGR